MAQTKIPSRVHQQTSDSETEAEETRVWLEFSWRCGYISKAEAMDFDSEYDRILAQLVRMIVRLEQWLIHSRATR